LIARELEAQGLSTTTISLLHGIIAKVVPPRSAILRAPLGRVTGKAFDQEQQKLVVKSALEAMPGMNEPGSIIKLPINFD